MLTIGAGNADQPFALALRHLFETLGAIGRHRPSRELETGFAETNSAGKGGLRQRSYAVGLGNHCDSYHVKV